MGKAESEGISYDRGSIFMVNSNHCRLSQPWNLNQTTRHPAHPMLFLRLSAHQKV